MTQNPNDHLTQQIADLLWAAVYDPLDEPKVDVPPAVLSKEVIRAAIQANIRRIALMLMGDSMIQEMITGIVRNDIVSVVHDIMSESVIGEVREIAREEVEGAVNEEMHKLIANELRGILMNVVYTDSTAPRVIN